MSCPTSPLALAMANAVPRSYTGEGSALEITKNLAILAASSYQLLIPMKAALALPTSKWECNTLRGLWTEI